MKSKLTTGLIILSVVAFSSCVSSKKYKASEGQVSSLQNELSAANNTIKSSNAKIADLNNQVAGLNSKVSTLTNQNAALSVDAGKYQRLKAEAKMSDDELNAALAAQGTSMKEIQEKLIAGLSALIDSGMDVTYKEGLLYITLPEKMLYPPSSATLSKSAKAALSPLASILNDYPKVAIYIVGHTDNAKVHTAKFDDNWSLSTERANGVVRAFIKDYSIEPSRLMSAGRSKFAPAATNDTKEGRALNRRINIVLNPGLIKLAEMMNQ